MLLKYTILWLHLSVEFVWGEDISATERTNVSRICVVSATRKTITIEVKLESSEHCEVKHVFWNFARGNGVFSRAEHKRLSHRVNNNSITYQAEILQLMPGTEYRIRVGIEDCRGLLRKDVLATTCPDVPQRVSHVKIDNVENDYFTVMWKPPIVTCASTSYYVLVSEFQKNVNFEIRKCPTQESKIQDTSLRRCRDQQDYFCHVQNITVYGSAQKIVRVVTTDSSNKCSREYEAYVQYWQKKIFLSELLENLKIISQYTFGFCLLILILGCIGKFLRERCSRRQISEKRIKISHEDHYQVSSV